MRARIIQLEDDLSNTRQQHRDASQEVNTTFILPSILSVKESA